MLAEVYDIVVNDLYRRDNETIASTWRGNKGQVLYKNHQFNFIGPLTVESDTDRVEINKHNKALAVLDALEFILRRAE